MFGFVANEFYFIILALGMQDVDGEWTIHTWKVYDGNICLLAVTLLEEIIEIPCKVIYITKGEIFYLVNLCFFLFLFF
jgi:hypothetical protein